MKTLQHAEAARAVDGAVVTGIGQLIGGVVGLAMAMLVPRWLGVSDYGNWIFYRSIISLVVGLSSLGVPEIVGRYYVGRISAGDPRAAAHVFKAVLAVRMAAAFIAAGVGFVIVRQSSGALSSLSDALCLAGSVMSQGAMLCFMLLLYGDRRMRAVSVVQVMQAATVPLAVLFTHTWGGLAQVPAGSFVGDLMCAAAAAGLARPWRIWAAGWLSFREHLTLFTLGGRWPSRPPSARF